MEAKKSKEIKKAKKEGRRRGMEEVNDGSQGRREES